VATHGSMGKCLGRGDYRFGHGRAIGGCLGGIVVAFIGFPTRARRHCVLVGVVLCQLQQTPQQ